MLAGLPFHLQYTQSSHQPLWGVHGTSLSHGFPSEAVMLGSLLVLGSKALLACDLQAIPKYLVLYGNIPELMTSSLSWKR